MKQKITKSERKFIRDEKSRIRREFLNPQEQEEKIKDLFSKFKKGKK